jgi:hypothetical protein
VKRLFAIGLALALGGCAALEPGVERTLVVDRIMGEAVMAARAPLAEQKAALARAEQAHDAERTEDNRLRLATLLATLPAPLRDDARSLELLEPLVDAGSAGVGRFAALLAAQVTERQRLGGELERVARDAERAAREADRTGREAERLTRERAAAERERERVERERAAAQRERERLERERDRREEALRQQLEALRSIEHSILEREERLRRKPR